LFFANSVALLAAVEAVTQDAEARGLKHLVIDCEAITDIDVTGAATFREVVRTTTDRGLQLHLSRLRSSLRDQFVEFRMLDGLNVYRTNREAARQLQTKDVDSNGVDSND
jgi:sulfate permease, SulP family